MRPFRAAHASIIVAALRARRRSHRWRAAARALRALTPQFPHLVEALFDLHFLRHRGDAVLRAVQEGSFPDPSELVQAWAEQWGSRDGQHASHAAEIECAARLYLDRFEGELRQPRSALAPDRRRARPA
jgi:hypothetical protein